MTTSTGITIEDAIDRVLNYHRRLERQVAALGRLPVYLELNAVDPAAAAIAGAALHCFGEPMRAHHREVETELLPLLEPRVSGAAEVRRFRELRSRLGADHREIDSAWRELRRPLTAIAEGLRRPLPEQPLACFRVLCALHISAEEAGLHGLVQRHLHNLRPVTKPSPG